MSSGFASSSLNQSLNDQRARFRLTLRGIGGNGSLDFHVPVKIPYAPPARRDGVFEGFPSGNMGIPPIAFLLVTETIFT